ncbi:MAG: biliverdin-producing heme oxygenase [Pseudomonadota bacterium]
MSEVKEFESVRKRLAHDTGPVHESLHHHPVLGALASEDLPTQTYRVILSAYAGFYGAVEASRERLRAHPELSLRPQVDALHEDLATLEEMPTALGEDALELESTPAVLGALYVLQGAGFGGRMLARQVALSLPQAPRRFLQDGVAKATWLALCAQLELVSEADYEDLCDAAMRTFHTLARHVEQAAAYVPLQSPETPAFGTGSRL